MKPNIIGEFIKELESKLDRPPVCKEKLWVEWIATKQKEEQMTAVTCGK